MKKLFTMLAVLAGLSMFSVYAQEEVAPISEEVATEQVEAISEEPAPAEVEEVAPVEEQQGGIHQALKTKFIEGGAGFMSTVALCLILGLAIAIERIIYLSLATTNSKKLLASVENALEILSATAANSSFVSSAFFFPKSRSCSLCSGTRWICACGTSIPSTATPTLLQGTALSIAFATLLAKFHNPEYVSTGRLKI